MTDSLEQSWNSFSAKVAGAYLKTYGHPSERSKQLLGEILTDHGGGRALSLLDLGCGNGQLYEYLKTTNKIGDYMGIDFSVPLLNAAREALGADSKAIFVQDDVITLSKVDRRFDFVIYSHVIEILAAPELSLQRAKQLGTKIIIRFFEPPEFSTNIIELREMDVGDEGKKHPYIRWKMSRDFYRLILTNIGCKRVDIYQAEGDKDQVHLLHFS